MFRVAKKDAKGGQGMTQFGRALCELNIEILCANSSQAKGRVERMNRTLQDRLVKELRLAGICDMEARQCVLAGFMEGITRGLRSPLPGPTTCIGRVNLAPDRLAGNPVQARAALCRRAADVFVRAQADHAGGE